MQSKALLNRKIEAKWDYVDHLLWRAALEDCGEKEPSKTKARPRKLRPLAVGDGLVGGDNNQQCPSLAFPSP